jgi:hypothetical protein
LSAPEAVLEDFMFTLLKEHRYIVQVASRTEIFRVEERISGPAWRSPFRLEIPAGAKTVAKKIYGASADEVAKTGAAFLT